MLVFFSFPQNFLNIVVILYRNFFYYLYLQVLKCTSRRATNIKKIVCHTTPYFTSVYITFLNSKSFFKAIGRSNILLTTTFARYQINNISTVTIQKIQTVLHIFSLVRVFLKITLKASLKVLLYVLKGFAILMRNLKSIVQNIKTI